MAQIDLAVDTVLDILSMNSGDFNSSEVPLDKIPDDIRQVVNKFVADTNISIEDFSKSGYVGKWSDDEHFVYAFTFEHADPEVFNGTILVGPADSSGKVGLVGTSTVGSS